MRAETEGMQGFVKQDTGIVAGEWTPRAVGAMHAGREADDQQAGPRIAEGRHRARMVIRPAATHPGKEAGQARTVGTVHERIH